MKCVILAAGYATRLYPLTQNYPKPLLMVGKKAIIDWIIEDLDSLECISEFIIVSNHKFVECFKEWKKSVHYRADITILDDGTIDNEHRLGAVKDIAYAIEACEIEEDLVVVAGDNLLDFSLKGFIDYFNEKQSTCVMCYYEDDLTRLRKTGVISLNKQGKILQMEEKPQQPKSHWAVPPFYIYEKSDLLKIMRAVQAKVCNVDAPGDMIAWLCKNSDIYAYKMDGNRYDIGTIESYEKVQEIMRWE